MEPLDELVGIDFWQCWMIPGGTLCLLDQGVPQLNRGESLPWFPLLLGLFVSVDHILWEFVEVAAVICLDLRPSSEYVLELIDNALLGVKPSIQTLELIVELNPDIWKKAKRYEQLIIILIRKKTIYFLLFCSHISRLFTILWETETCLAT